MPPRYEMPSGPVDSILEINLENVPVHNQIDLLTTRMQDHPNDAIMVGHSLHLLVPLLMGNNHLVSAFSGAVDQVISMIQNHDTNENLMEGATFFLFQVYTADMNEDTNVLETRAQGQDMIPLLVATMDAFQANEAIQRFGALCIMPFVENDTVWNIVVETNAFAAVFSAVSKFKDDPIMTSAGVVFMTVLVNRDVLLEKIDGISTLVAFFQHHVNDPTHPAVVGAMPHGLKVLGAVADNGRNSCATAFVNSGGIKVLLDLVPGCTLNEDYRFRVLEMFRYLADNNGASEAFLHEKGTQTLIGVMNGHLDCAKTTMGVCMTMFGFCSCSGDVVGTFVAEGGFEPLSRVLNRHLGDMHVLNFALGIIGTGIGSTKAESVKKAIDESPDIARHVVAAIHKHGSNEPFLEIALITLSKIACISDRACQSIVRSGGLLVLTNATKKFTSNETIQGTFVHTVVRVISAGMLALSQGIDGIDGEAIIKSVKAAVPVRNLVGVLRRFPDNSSLVSDACFCLYYMSNIIAGVTEEIRSAGGTKLLWSIQKKTEDPSTKGKLLSLFQYLQDSKDDSSPKPF